MKTTQPRVFNDRERHAQRESSCLSAIGVREKASERLIVVGDSLTGAGAHFCPRGRRRAGLSRLSGSKMRVADSHRWSINEPIFMHLLVVAQYGNLILREACAW